VQAEEVEKCDRLDGFVIPMPVTSSTIFCNPMTRTCGGSGRARAVGLPCCAMAHWGIFDSASLRRWRTLPASAQHPIHPTSRPLNIRFIWRVLRECGCCTLHSRGSETPNDRSRVSCVPIPGDCTRCPYQVPQPIGHGWEAGRTAPSPTADLCSP
jgi:hypothetical protein